MPESNGRYSAGLQVRREVLGAPYVDRALQKANQFTAPFQDLVTEYCWGAVWTRPNIDRKTRSLLNLAMLPGLKQWDEFALHVRGAVTNGCSIDEIRETLLQVTIYCGVPVGVEAFRIASGILEDLGLIDESREPKMSSQAPDGSPREQ